MTEKKKCKQAFFKLIALSAFSVFSIFNSYGQRVIKNDLSKDRYENVTIQISKFYDLKNRKIEFVNTVIELRDKGQIANGTLLGKDNVIKNKKTSVFQNVAFGENFLKGAFYTSWWYVPSSIDKLKNNAKIQEIFNSIPNSSSLIFDKSYNVLCDPIFKINNKKNIYIDFNKTHFYTDKSAGTNSIFLLLISSKNITINNIFITGDTKFHLPGDKGEWGMGIQISGGENIQIRNSTITQCWGDNIYINGDSNYNPPRAILITNCSLIDGRRNNISIINADGVDIVACKIIRTKDVSENLRGTDPYTGIDLEPNFPDKEKVINFSVKDSYFTMDGIGRVGVKNYNNPNGHTFSVINCKFESIGRAMHFTKSEKIVISSCTFTKIKNTPIKIENVNDIEVKDNIFSSVPYPNRTIEENFDIKNVNKYRYSNNQLMNR